MRSTPRRRRVGDIEVSVVEDSTMNTILARRSPCAATTTVVSSTPATPLPQRRRTDAGGIEAEGRASAWDSVHPKPRDQASSTPWCKAAISGVEERAQRRLET